MKIDYTILSIGCGDNYTSQDDVQFKRNVDMNYCYVDYPGLIRGKEEIKVDYIIQYSNSVDQAIVEVMANRLNCPTINCLRPYAYL